jgi:hypothetical protein
MIHDWRMLRELAHACGSFPEDWRTWGLARCTSDSDIDREDDGLQLQSTTRMGPGTGIYHLHLSGACC